MAARIEPAPEILPPDLVHLRRLGASDLEPLLQEEIQTWQSILDWDFSKSADLVRRFVDLRALNGYALAEQGVVVGYTYYVFEDHKGLVGDLFVRREFRTVENENRLLDASLQALTVVPHISRIESQLIMLDPVPGRPIPGAPYLRSYERNFMSIDLGRVAGLPPGRFRQGIYADFWSDRYQEGAAQLIEAAYDGHLDSQINDQYRSVTGARRFLFNIVQYPGCGAFFRPASFAAFEMDTGRICGLCLSSIVAPGIGHITQICVAPWARGQGIGYELLRQSLQALHESGCRKASLTVTASNARAVQLYKNVGFATVRRFFACVWEGF